MADSAAIAAAIAARFAILVPPAGQPAIALATHELPANLTRFPTALVLPPEGGDVELAGHKLSLTWEYPVLLFLPRTDDLPRRAAMLHAWVTASYKALVGSVMLGGLASVALLRLVIAGTVGYEGTDYDGIHWVASVHVTEGVEAVA